MSHYHHAEQLFRKQIGALERTLSRLEPAFSDAVEVIRHGKGKVVVTGVGKSGLIAHKIAATLASTGTPAVFLNASEALHGDLGMVSAGDVVLMLSKSGTTIELVKMLPTLEKVGAQTIGIFGNTTTRLAKALHVVLDGSVEEEGGLHDLAPMSSTTVALVVGDALAETLMHLRSFQPEDFALFHPAGQLGRNLLLTTADVMHRGEALPQCRRDDSLKKVLVEMTRKNLGAVCICDEKQHLEGIITDGDVRRWFSQTETLSVQAAALMTPHPVSLSPEMKLAEAIAIMENPRRQIYVAPVVEDGKCLGLVRMHDILQS